METRFLAAVILLLAISPAFAQSGTLQFSQPLFTISEAGPIVSTNVNGVRFLNPTMTVTRTGGSTGSVSVNYATSSTLPAVVGDHVAIGAGIAGTHYTTTTTGTLTCADGDNAVKTFTVPLPATGNANGALNVAVNLSATMASMLLPLFRRVRGLMDSRSLRRLLGRTNLHGRPRPLR